MTQHSRALKRWTLYLSLVLTALVVGMLYQLWVDAKGNAGNTGVTSDISSVRIQRGGFADILITKIDQQWQITSPCSVAVNEQRLVPLFGALESGGQQYLATDVDLEAAGLASPSAIIYLDGLDYRIGNTDVNGTKRYLQRADTVRFVPEWALSLVNGGVTAMAQLELFTQPIAALKLSGDQNDRQRSLEPDTWQSLTAQQIIVWPLDDSPSTPTYSVTSTNQEGAEQTLMIFETDRYTAVTFDDASCAYILEPDALPR